MTQTTLNYEEELKSIPEHNPFFKPPIGTSIIVPIGEATREKWKDRECIHIPIEVNGQKMKWTINKSGKASLYYQLLQFATKNNNTIVGKKITLIAKETERNFNGHAAKNYTILEAQ